MSEPAGEPATLSHQPPTSAQRAASPSASVRPCSRVAAPLRRACGRPAACGRRKHAVVPSGLFRAGSRRLEAPGAPKRYRPTQQKVTEPAAPFSASLRAQGARARLLSGMPHPCGRGAPHRMANLRANLPQVRGANLRLANFSQVTTQVRRDFPCTGSPVEPSQHARRTHRRSSQAERFWLSIHTRTVMMSVSHDGQAR